MRRGRQAQVLGIERQRFSRIAPAPLGRDQAHIGLRQLFSGDAALLFKTDRIDLRGAQCIIGRRLFPFIACLLPLLCNLFLLLPHLCQLHGDRVDGCIHFDQPPSARRLACGKANVFGRRFAPRAARRAHSELARWRYPRFGGIGIGVAASDAAQQSRDNLGRDDGTLRRREPIGQRRRPSVALD